MEYYFRKLVEQQAKTNELLQRLLELNQQEVELLQNELLHLLDEPLMDKFQVMDCLKISDATYRRYVKDGKLSPMSFDKIDWYYRRDLAIALRESRRKGRL